MASTSEPRRARPAVLREPSPGPSRAASFRGLYEDLAPALQAWVRPRIPPDVRALVDPQDVAQEVWCRAWRERQRLDLDRRRSRAWVFAVARRVLPELARRARPPAGCRGDEPRSSASPEEAEVALERVEDLERLLAWLDGLEPQQRHLLLRHGLEEASFGELSAELGLRRDAVAKRWQRLRRRLEERGPPRALWPGDERPRRPTGAPPARAAGP